MGSDPISLFEKMAQARARLEAAAWQDVALCDPGVLVRGHAQLGRDQIDI